MATTTLRACDVPEVRQDLIRWADENIERGLRGSGAVQVNGFTDPWTFQSAARAAEQFYVNDQMTWLARDIGEGLPVCAFDVDSLPEPVGFLVWSEDPSAHTATLGRPRAVLTTMEPGTPPDASTGTNGSFDRTGAPTPTRTIRAATRASG